MNITKTKQSRGITFIELLVVLAVVAILGGMLLPALTGGGPSRSARCFNNLRQIGGGFQAYAGDHGGKFPMQLSTNEGGTREYRQATNAFRHFLIMGETYVGSPRIFLCPYDKERKGTNQNMSGLQNASLSYFVSLTAEPAYTNIILAGDRNLTRDGSRLAPGLYTLEAGRKWGWDPAELHPQGGSMLLVNGAMQRFSSGIPPATLSQSGTNIIAIP